MDGWAGIDGSEARSELNMRSGSCDVTGAARLCSADASSAGAPSAGCSSKLNRATNCSERGRKKPSFQSSTTACTRGTRSSKSASVVAAPLFCVARVSAPSSVSR